MNHLKRPPARPHAQGYRPEPEPFSFGQVMFGMALWLIVIAVGTGFALPLINHLVRWVLGGDHG